MSKPKYEFLSFVKFKKKNKVFKPEPKTLEYQHNYNFVFSTDLDKWIRKYEEEKD